MYQSPFTSGESFTYAWVLHGTINRVVYLYATLDSSLPLQLQTDILWWIDDIPIHNTTLVNLIDTTSRTFYFCEEYILKLCLENCEICSTSIHLCSISLLPKTFRLIPVEFAASSMSPIQRLALIHNSLPAQCCG